VILLEQKRSLLPSVARYPIFFLGLLILIVGGVLGIRLDAPSYAEVTLAVIGFILLAVSVAVR
jgi:hypothetical protein